MRFLSLIPIVFLAATQAFAALNLAEPDVLLTKARQSRIDLRDVVFDIDKNIVEFTELEQMDKYLFILPELQYLSDQFMLDDLYPKAVKRLGESMFSAAIKWLDVRTVPQEQILRYAAYANFDLAFRYADSIADVLNKERSQERLIQGANTVEALHELFLKTLPDQPGLEGSLRNILSDLANKHLSRPGLTEEQTLFWIGKISSTYGVTTYLDVIGNKIILLNRENAMESHLYVTRLIQLRDRMLKLENEIPGYLTTNVSDKLSELIQRMILLQVVFEPNEFEKILAAMAPNTVRQLSQSIIARDSEIPMSYGDEYIRLMQILLNTLQSYGFDFEAKEFGLYMQRSIAPIMIKRYSAEGNFNLKDHTGKAWIFSITQVRKNMHYAALGTEDRSIFKSFYYVQYDFKNKKFVAFERGPDLDGSANQVVSFRITSDGAIKFEDLYSLRDVKTLTGKKVSLMPLYNDGLEDTSTITGRYKGSITIKEGSTSKAELIISVMNGFVMGRLNLAKDGVVYASLDYSVGSEIATGRTIHLTTGKLGSGTWSHLRLGYYGDKVRGVMIQGGRGTISEEFELKRVPEEGE